MMTDSHIVPRVLAPSNYRRMPWKNGGGFTTEIFVAPPDAAFDAFAWRVSLADVDESGPFSTFAGIDRILVLTSGSGMRLMGEGAPLDVTRQYEPIRFPGERSLQCALVSGPVRDFNLMVRRRVARGDVHIVRNHAPALPRADAYLCYAACGGFQCRVAGAEMIALAAEHSLLVEPRSAGSAKKVVLHSQSPDAVALVAAIEWQ